jgi:hypothetical protein
MIPPTWTDQDGRARPTRPCARCGREAPVFEWTPELGRLVGWEPFAVASFVNWCGHVQEFIPIPNAEGGCWLVPVLGEAS